jgi:hypothetical protein
MLSETEREDLSARAIAFADQFGDVGELAAAEALHAARFPLPVKVCCAGSGGCYGCLFVSLFECDVTHGVRVGAAAAA